MDWDLILAVETRLFYNTRPTQGCCGVRKWASGPFFVCGDDMRQKPGELQKLLEPAVTGLGFELVGIEYHPSGKHSLLRVYIDSENGVTVDDCARVSYQVSGVLDVEDPIPGNYQLEVSSPGLDRPLFRPEDYDRFAGQQVKLTLLHPLDGRRKFSGVLRGLQGEQVFIVLEDGTDVGLPIGDIEKARLVPDL